MLVEELHRLMSHNPTLRVYPVMENLEQEGQKCPKRWVAQAAIRLATAVIKFRNKERNVRSPS